MNRRWSKAWRRYDYVRSDFYRRQHLPRYVAYTERFKLTCQECGGMGRIGYDSIYDGPADPCGFCETTGRVTPHMRGLWLRWKRDEKRKAA
jgi:hypothetical protein